MAARGRGVLCCCEVRRGEVAGGFAAIPELVFLRDSAAKPISDITMGGRHNATTWAAPVHLRILRRCTLYLRKAGLSLPRPVIVMWQSPGLMTMIHCGAQQQAASLRSPRKRPVLPSLLKRR